MYRKVVLITHMLKMKNGVEKLTSRMLINMDYWNILGRFPTLKSIRYIGPLVSKSARLQKTEIFIYINVLLNTFTFTTF